MYPSHSLLRWPSVDWLTENTFFDIVVCGITDIVIRIIPTGFPHNVFLNQTKTQYE